MRIIHTSDWHLGQHFMGKTREREHRRFLDWLLNTVQTREADVLVVTGDIFDTGTPPSYARTLYNEFIVSLQTTCCSRAVFLGGNHDSAATLNEGKALLSCLKTEVMAGMSDRIEDHLVLVRNRDGLPGLLICALPYLRPSDLVKSTAGQTGQEKKESLGQAIEGVYARIYEAALAARKALKSEACGKEVPIMATGHLTVVGASVSESVRDIYIGSLSGFPAAGFPPADYIALGHLHKAQAVGHIHYSGSPIPLSFDEAGQTKQVIQVEFTEDLPPEILQIPIPGFRSLISLKGNLETIGQTLASLAREAAGPEDDIAPRTWLEVEVAEDDFLSDLTERVQGMITDAGLLNMELLRVRRKRQGAGPGLAPEAVERLEELNPKEVFQRRLALEDLDPDRKTLLLSMFDQVLEQIFDPSSDREAGQ